MNNEWNKMLLKSIEENNKKLIKNKNIDIIWTNLLNKQLNNLKNEDKKIEQNKEEYTNLYNYITRFIFY